MFGMENAMQRGIRKILPFVKLLIAAIIFGKITLKPSLVISNDSSPNGHKFYSAPQNAFLDI